MVALVVSIVEHYLSIEFDLNQWVAATYTTV